VRDAFPSTPYQLSPGFSNGQSLFFRLRFIINRCITQSDCHRINERFQQPDQGGELGFGQTVNQLVGVLPYRSPDGTPTGMRSGMMNSSRNEDGDLYRR
jgi:hypothetical protein